MPQFMSPALRWISGSSVLAIVCSSFFSADSATILEGFESGSKPAYAAGNVTLTTGVWNLNDALIGNTTTDPKVGSQSTRVRYSGKVSMQFDRSTGAGTVSIKHAKYGSDASTSWQLWCSTNSGSSWLQIGSTVTTSSTALQTATFPANLAGPVRCEVRKTDGTANRVNLDDIQITDYGSTSSLPPGTGPFFDSVYNPVSGLRYPSGSSADATPVPYTFSTFDQAVANVCGAPGKKVTRTEFQTLMNSYPTVLANVKTRMGVSSGIPNSTFLSDLTNIWFNAEGFNHVFCGEPVAGGAIGGMHFVGRYQDLQNQGLAGRLSNNTANEEVVPSVIYTIGAKVIVSGGTSQSNIKGFGYTLNAEDILAFGGYGYIQNPNSSATTQACKFAVSDDGYTFTAVFVSKTSGIRTFYPDATPSATDPNCTQ